MNTGETITSLEALVETVEADAKLAELVGLISRSNEISECTLANVQECNRLVETNPFSTPCGHPIACDGSAGGEYSATVDINGPDAKLIAAAPDMAEALIDAAAMLPVAPKLHPDDLRKLQTKVIAALQKAGLA